MEYEIRKIYIHYSGHLRADSAFQYFLETKNGIDFPPAINHPEYYYGFIGVGIAWQIAFLIIGKNPLVHRALMIPAMVKKFSFAIAAAILFISGRVPPILFGLEMIDLLFGMLFVLAFWLTRDENRNFGY